MPASSIHKGWFNDAANSRIEAHYNGTAFLRGTATTLAVPSGITLSATSPSFTTPALGAATATSIAATGAVTSSGATAGIGYATGAGGTVTQITSRTTGVTLNTISGTITTDTTSLAAEVSATFTVTNSSVAIGDVVVLAVRSGMVAANTVVTVNAVAAGSFDIKVNNQSAAGGAAETGAIVINFAVIKAVSA